MLYYYKYYLTNVLESLISVRGFTANISNPVAFYLPMADRYFSAVSSCSIFSVSEVASPSISFPLLLYEAATPPTVIVCKENQVDIVAKRRNHDSP